MKDKVSNVYVLFSLLSIVVMVIAQLTATVVYLLPLHDAIANILSGCIALILAYFLLKALNAKLLKVDFAFSRIPTIRFKPIWILSAFVLPIFVSALFFIFPGQFTNNNLPLDKKFTVLTSAVMLAGISAGVIEEVVFRGIIMTALEKRWNRTIAIFVPSVLFAVLHVLGRQLDFSSVLLLLISGTCVGVLFSLITIQSGSIWNSVIVHVVWNTIVIGGIVTIGTTNSPDSMYSYVLDSRSLFLTGGDFGIEASSISIAGYIVFSMLALFLMRRHPSLHTEPNGKRQNEE
ncbi:MAG: CPBP family intramembrane glutamic endopeptidase [Sphaerochaetaceae bacterium]